MRIDLEDAPVLIKQHETTMSSLQQGFEVNEVLVIMWSNSGKRENYPVLRYLQSLQNHFLEGAAMMGMFLFLDFSPVRFGASTQR